MGNLPLPETLRDHRVKAKSVHGTRSRVFRVSSLLVLVFLAGSVFAREQMEAGLGALQTAIVRNASWFFSGTMNAMLLLCVVLFFSRYGNLKLGKRGDSPEHSLFSWLAMLFGAGMGIGLLFWSVAEPVLHFHNPPFGEGGTPGAAGRAMVYTFFHWGLHAWAVYCVCGMALAYFSFRHGFPLSPRSAFAPLLGLRIRGTAGDVIAVLAVVATLFGVATSLGFGAMQINAGLSHLGWVPQGAGVALLIIALITGLATVSVVLGLDRGIRRLSEITMILAVVFLLFVFLAGPTLSMLNGLVQNTGAYLSQLVVLSTWTDTYRHTGWQEGWTTFYWSWWIAWAPFVGTFIARISKGRTIREFILGVLVFPTGATFVWLTIFGTSALEFELAGNESISRIAGENPAIALFVFLEELPVPAWSSLLAILLLVLFFVTSSDSGSMVVDSIASGGKLNTPVWQRIYWALLEGGIAAALLFAGGLLALQAGSLSTGLPFAVVLLFLGYGLLLVVQRDSALEESRRKQECPTRTPPPRALD